MPNITLEMSNPIIVGPEKILVVEDDRVRYSVPADEPARNVYGNETGRTWGEEFKAGNLFVVQWDDPGFARDAVGSIYAGEEGGDNA